MKQEDNKIDVREDEKHLLLDHDYDNIQELNHPLPNWWNIIFGISTIFAVIYFVYYEMLDGPSLREEFRVEYKEILAKQAEFKRENAAFNSDTYLRILSEDGLRKGKEVYELNCLPCHAEGGIGDVGPNLTDDHWLIAKGTPGTVYDVIFNGSEANGMPIWSDMISQEEIYQVTAYVMAFHNTFKKGKGPEGEKIADEK